MQNPKIEINEKAKALKSYYASVFGCGRNIPQTQTQTPHSSEPFTIRKRLAATGINKSVRPGGVPGKILKLGEEAMIPYLARLLDVTVNRDTTPGDCKRAIVVPLYMRADGSAVTSCRPVSLTSVVCKKMEHVIAGYLRQVSGYTKANVDADRDTRAGAR